MEMSSHIQESPRRNPDWWAENIFLVSIKLKNYLNISFPIIFYKLAIKILLGNFQLTLSWRRSLPYRNQSFDLVCKSRHWFLYDRDRRHERVNCLFPFLWARAILLFFPDVRKMSRLKTSLKNIVNGLNADGTHSFSDFTDILCWPWVLFGSRLWVSCRITSGKMLREHITSVISQLTQSRRRSAIVVDCSAWAGEMCMQYVAFVSSTVMIIPDMVFIRYLWYHFPIP